MRITTFLLILLIATYVIQGFNAPKCKHIFVSVEQETIKIEQPKWSGVDDLMPPWTKWPTGLQEGKELICVKCFHKQKQVLDYGEPSVGTLVWPERSIINKADCCDSINMKLLIGGSGLIKFDSIVSK